jgi:hypothetical protein
MERSRSHDAEAIVRLTAQTEANNARLAVLMERLALADEAGDGAEQGLAKGLHGARLEMEVLKRRLDALQEVEGAGRTARDADDPTPGDRHKWRFGGLMGADPR